MSYVIKASAVKYYPEIMSLTTGKGILCVSKGEAVAETRIITWFTAAEVVTYDLCIIFFLNLLQGCLDNFKTKNKIQYELKKYIFYLCKLFFF